MKRYKVKVDTQEKVDFWMFSPSNRCSGSIRTHLPTGDYTLEGYEKKFVIERKANTGEFATNINEKRFKKELERLQKFDYPHIICEFTWDDVYSFPKNSGIPQYLWKDGEIVRNLWNNLKVTSHYIAKAIAQIQLKYGVHVHLCGDHGKMLASNLFKRVMELNI